MSGALELVAIVMWSAVHIRSIGLHNAGAFKRRSTAIVDTLGQIPTNFRLVLGAFTVVRSQEEVWRSVPPHFEIKANTYHSGTTFPLLRRCCPSSIRVPKIASPRMANVCDDTRSPHNGGGISESGYSVLTKRWKMSDGYFKVMSRHPVRAGQLSPRPHPDREAPSRRKGPRIPSLHSESWRRNSRALLNNCHLCQLHPRYPR